jgi:hypothetical protein
MVINTNTENISASKSFHMNTTNELPHWIATTSISIASALATAKNGTWKQH